MNDHPTSIGMMCGQHEDSSATGITYKLKNGYFSFPRNKKERENSIFFFLYFSQETFFFIFFIGTNLSTKLVIKPGNIFKLQGLAYFYNKILTKYGNKSIQQKNGFLKKF